MRKKIKEKFEFYRTPHFCALLAKPLMDPTLRWWEPCAGDGAISNTLDVSFASDINPRIDKIHKLDVFSCDKPENIDAAITNPPCSFTYDIIDKFLFDFKIPILLLIRVEPLSTKINNSYTKHLKEMHIVSELIKFETENGRIVNGNGTMRCAWCLFTPEKVEYTKTKWVKYF